MTESSVADDRPAEDMIGPSGDEADAEASTWLFPPGHEFVPGVLAWDLLGIGRRFEVWIGWCRDRLTPVCVKLPRRDSLDRRTIEALGRERATVASLAHPAIPRLFGADLESSLPHLVYEFIEGRPLSVILDEDGPFDAHDTIFIGLQLAAALRHLHARGFVHLDLKPSNVTLRGERAILLDFDIALPVGGLRSTSRPRGTAWYMAPEQIRCEPAHPSMDLFALGAVLYETLTGDRRFDVGSDELPTDSDDLPPRFPQLSGDPGPADLSARGVPASLVAAIDALLHPEPSKRPADAGEAIALLDAALPPDSERLWPEWVPGAMLGPAQGVDGAGPWTAKAPQSAG